MQTPCIQICVIDEESQLCSGCGRTLDEIVSWSRYGDDERSRIMQQLPTRMNALKSTPKSITV